MQTNYCGRSCEECEHRAWYYILMAFLTNGILRFVNIYKTTVLLEQLEP